MIWPQFAKHGELPFHGFARTATWTLVSLIETEISSTAMLSLFAPMPVWGENAYSVHYEVVLAWPVGAPHSSLTCRLTAKNMAPDTPLSFTGALHAYLNVSDVQHTTVGTSQDRSPQGKV